MSVCRRIDNVKNSLLCLVGGGQNSKTTVVLTINLTGTLPASTAIAGAYFTLTLPAHVTPAMTNGAVSTGVVSNSGTFAGSTISQVNYTAATTGAPSTLDVFLANSVPGGVTQVGEVATITLQLANGVAPSVDGFVVSAVKVVDAEVYSTISGMGVTVANLLLQ